MANNQNCSEHGNATTRIEVINGKKFIAVSHYVAIKHKSLQVGRLQLTRLFINHIGFPVHFRKVAEVDANVGCGSFLILHS